MPGVITKILNLLTILKIFYYFTTKAIIRSLFINNKDIQGQWARMVCEYLQVRLQQLQGSKEMLRGRVMIFANHRSQADFFLHNTIAKYQTNFLSRMAVLIAAPVFITSYRTVWFFNRGKKTDPEKFNQWLDYKFRKSNRPGLLVYPEGHRMQGSLQVDPNKIRTGMIKYAYRRRIPSQILMTFGNEDVMDEKRLHIGTKGTVYYKFSEVVDPASYETEAEFIDAIKQKFCKYFADVCEHYQQNRVRRSEVTSAQSL